MHVLLLFKVVFLRCKILKSFPENVSSNFKHCNSACKSLERKNFLHNDITYAHEKCSGNYWLRHLLIGEPQKIRNIENVNICCQYVKIFTLCLVNHSESISFEDHIRQVKKKSSLKMALGLRSVLVFDC